MNRYEIEESLFKAMEELLSKKSGNVDVFGAEEKERYSNLKKLDFKLERLHTDDSICLFKENVFLHKTKSYGYCYFCRSNHETYFFLVLKY